MVFWFHITSAPKIFTSVQSRVLSSDAMEHLEPSLSTEWQRTGPERGRPGCWIRSNWGRSAGKAQSGWMGFWHNNVFNICLPHWLLHLASARVYITHFASSSLKITTRRWLWSCNETHLAKAPAGSITVCLLSKSGREVTERLGDHS